MLLLYLYPKEVIKIIFVCLTHDAINPDMYKWYPLPYGDDIMDVVEELQLPACLTTCPKCEYQTMHEHKRFLQGGEAKSQELKA